jgi:peptidylprolyl isomerase
MRLILPALLLSTASLLAACDRKADPPTPVADTTKVPPVVASAPPAATSAEPTAEPASTPGAMARKEPADLPAPADVAAPPADAQKTPSGLASKVLTKGTGKDKPGPNDSVKVHYTGWTADGKMFDSSVVRNDPASFRLDQVIPGWTEGLQLMVTGEQRRFWIPGKLAYGDHARPGMPSGQLTFDVTLLEFTPAPKPPPVPEDVKAAPASAKKTKSGLAYRVLKPGKGDSPSATDVVTVHYSGWTPDGKMFDSSIVRGEPTSFPLNRVIPGWTEGVQLMKVGEKTRFWIPSDLAYGDKPRRPGAPAGPLVFDIELISIQKH